MNTEVPNELKAITISNNHQSNFRQFRLIYNRILVVVRIIRMILLH